ncbi:ThiF family adenylyltransferase [Microbacterium aquimaris]|uniref:ThiF family adenylyltransferase n=1 Tax=Microbacterium aquimaris TaxID=459816 RepID=A0ABU5N9R0_9MICO|nr:ThiF family adenylyltransferase [Microbacterium aquimaris]MDZ8162786.1 ThiF family adenylyltransferase [Microbacterium aquimaris]
MTFPPLVAPVDALIPDEASRTARHHALPQVGDAGQRRLAAARIAVVGAGGLGSPVILALAAAGVGMLRIIDDDHVEVSNLQRQIIHDLDTIGDAKAESAARRARALSRAIRVETVTERLGADNAGRLLDGCDLVIDGSDSFATRDVVDAACARLGVPVVWGSVLGGFAQVTVFWATPPEPATGIRLSDLFPPGAAGEPPNCATAGVLGTLCLHAGAVMATEAVKLVMGVGEPLFGRICVLDAFGAKQRELPLRPSPTPIAGTATPAIGRVSVATLRATLDDDRAPTLLDVREAEEVAGGRIPGAVHIPLAHVLADPLVAGAARVVVVCERGPRAERAAEALRAAGVEATVLDGGMAAWRAAQRRAVGVA